MNSKFPKQVYLDTNATCNLRCTHCDIHLLRNPSGELTLAERQDLIRQLGAWSPQSRLAFSGGEPFLRRKDLYILAETAKISGIHLSLNTNGTLLKPEDLERIPHSGIRTAVFSIDSHLESVHDRMRGVPGTFSRVTRATLGLAKSIRASRGKCMVLISAILGSHNLQFLPELVELSENLMSDGILFQPIQPNFERAVPSEWWLQTEYFPLDQAKMDAGLDNLLQLKAAGKRILQSTSQIEDMRHYFRQPEKLAQGHCASMDSHLVIDMLGEVRLCFNQDRLGLRPVGNVRENSLQEIWERSRSTARQMQNCQLECGAMLCHAR
ncbi:MAG: radical SAM protein [Bacteroidia bacterium]|nr:radical SAM protein [Bacteroidia bacterium]